jgi:nitrogen fixation NifU-like protein
MAKYPKLLIDHFQNPKNVGEIPDADGVGTVGNAHCGDIMQMYIKLNGNKIIEAKFKTFGCGAAIATSSILTERIKGATLDEALNI